jgi:hypothetical protein
VPSISPRASEAASVVTTFPRARGLDCFEDRLNVWIRRSAAFFVARLRPTFGRSLPCAIDGL